MRNADSLPSRRTLTPAVSRRVARPAPLRHAVYEALRDMIINGSLRPGEHLVEGRLAEHLRVSRQPVREALQRLQTEGWVDLRPAHGAFVHTPTEEEVSQLLAVRSLLETYAAWPAAERATSPDVGRLWQLQRNGLDALAANDPNGLVAANAAMHAVIVELSGNAVLAELISHVDRRIRWYCTPIARPPGAAAWNEHAELIQAIADGDGRRASEVMRRHTEHTIAAHHEPRSRATDAGRPFVPV